MRRGRANTLRSWRSDADDVATQAALVTLGRRARPDPDIVEKIQAADVERAYRDLVGADSIVISVVGDFLPQGMMEFLEKNFGGIRARAAPLARSPSNVTPVKFILIDRAKGEQTTIAAATPAPRVDEPDAPAFRLLCSVLEGRLEGRTRLAKGYTYGVDVSCSSFWPYLHVTMNVDGARSKQAMEDLLAGFQSTRETAPTEKELAAARVALASRITSATSSNAGAARHFGHLAALGLSLDATDKLYAGTATVTGDDVREAARRWLADPHVVVVGDATAITGDISSVGFGAPIVKSMP